MATPGQSGSARSAGEAMHILAFDYPTSDAASTVLGWEGWGPGQVEENARKGTPAGPSEASVRSEFERKLAEETRRSHEAGRELGREEGRRAEREALAAAERDRKRQALEMVEGFRQERDRFLHAVEREVVQLALAVAARILRREAQMDPLLLTGAVRVALGQLAATTEVRLRVPPAEQDLWTEAITLLPNLALKPAVVAGEGMRLGDCRIETELGSVDLGIRAQLGEIERGFFDRAGAVRPREAQP